MDTLTQTPKHKLPFAMDNAQGIQFPCESTAEMTLGKLVTLKSDGLVYPSANGSVDEMPIGYVTVPNQREKRECTIDTFGIAKAGAIASASVSVGDKLKVASDGKVRQASTGTYAIGIALTEAAENEEVMVMYFYSPVYIA